MSVSAMSLQHFLQECVETSKLPGVRMEVQQTESVDMECASSNLTIRFAKHASSPALINIKLLLDKLRAKTSVASIDLVVSPETQLVILGSAEERNYRIAFELSDETPE